MRDKLDMTFVEMAQRKNRREKRKQKMAVVSLLARLALCIPCGLFAFFHCDVFLRYTWQILEAAGVLVCLFVLVIAFEDLMERREKDDV